MKNQYVGDESDYLKYALLRALQTTCSGALHICWMLTKDDSGPDGMKLGYLDRPERYRQVDPHLFEMLRAVIAQQRRSVAGIAAAEVLPGAQFHDDLLPDARDRRADYFDAFRPEAKALVFFDPDNGLEIPSKKLGAKNSNKFVFWSEIEGVAPNRSVLIFQHWNRSEKRDPMVERLFGELQRRMPDHRAFALRGPNVLFLAAVLPEEVDDLIAAAREVAVRWPKPLTVQIP